jgi:hypothetical protein
MIETIDLIFFARVGHLLLSPPGLWIEKPYSLPVKTDIMLAHTACEHVSCWTYSMTEDLRRAQVLRFSENVLVLIRDYTKT